MAKIIGAAIQMQVNEAATIQVIKEIAFAFANLSMLHW